MHGHGFKMSNYTPDNWVVIKFPTHYRLLVGWSGGYLYGDSYRINSGITSVDYDGDYYFFRGSSGSCYVCHKECYRLRKNNTYVWDKIKEIHGSSVELMPEDTDWMGVEWK